MNRRDIQNKEHLHTVDHGSRWVKADYIIKAGLKQYGGRK